MTARFFTEGIATALALGGPGVYPRYVLSDEELLRPIWDPRATMTARDSWDVNYATAAAFITYLLVRHGPEPFHEFYRGLGGPPTWAWLEACFRDAYGLELQDEIAGFLAGIPKCEPDSHPVLIPECSRPRVEWTSERLWEHSVSLACDQPGVVGGIGPNYAWPSFYAVTIDVPVGGYHVVSLSNQELTGSFGPCFGCPWDQRDVEFEGQMSQKTLVLEPGTYYLRVNANSDEAPEVTLRLQRL